MHPPETIRGVTQNAELRNGRVVDVERREHDARDDGIGVSLREICERELKHPRLAAPDEYIADELRVLGGHRARLLVPHAAADGCGDFERDGQLDPRERSGDAETQAIAVVGFHFPDGREDLRAGIGRELGPRIFNGAHAENPRQLRHRIERGSDAVAAFEQARFHQARRLVLLGGREPVLISSLRNCGEFGPGISGCLLHGACLGDWWRCCNVGRQGSFSDGNGVGSRG